MVIVVVVLLRVKTSENSRKSRSTKNALYNLRSSFQDEIRSFPDKKKQENIQSMMIKALSSPNSLRNFASIRSQSTST
jgi:hypothetical protein